MNCWIEKLLKTTFKIDKQINFRTFVKKNELFFGTRQTFCSFPVCLVSRVSER